MPYKKIIILLCFFILIIFDLNSQESDGQITLPDVTTVASGDSLTIGEDNYPEYNSVENKVIREDYKPILPLTDESVIQGDFSSIEQKSDNDKINLSTFMGGGYPGSFLSDVSIAGEEVKNPYAFNFGYQGVFNYGLYNASQGFYDNCTDIGMMKKLNGSNVESIFDIRYLNSSYGLQGLSDVYSQLLFEKVDAENSTIWDLPNNFNITLDLDGIFSNVYPLTESFSNAFVYDIYVSPDFNLSWSNEYVKADFKVDYVFENYENFFVNRGEISLSGDLKINTFYIGGQSGVVFSNKKDKDFFVIPEFNIYVKNDWLNVEGGLKTSLVSYSSLIEKYKFALLDSVTYETSDWNADIMLNIPVLSNFTINGTLGFKTTAFNNGEWNCLYNSISSDGIYLIEQTERTALDSRINAIFVYEWITVEGMWNVHWLYVPGNDYRHTIALSFDIDSDDFACGASFKAIEPLGSGIDYVPIINSEVSYKIKNNCIVILNINDIIKLFSNSTRKYYTTDYVTKAGEIGLYLKVTY